MLKQHFRVCCCFWRHFNLVSPQVHADIKEIFQQYSEDGLMTVNNLHTFLIEIQEERDASKEQAQEIIDNLRHLHLFPRKGLHVEAFFRYLLSDHNIPLSTKVFIFLLP